MTTTTIDNRILDSARDLLQAGLNTTHTIARLETEFGLSRASAQRATALVVQAAFQRRRRHVLSPALSSSRVLEGAAEGSAEGAE